MTQEIKKEVLDKYIMVLNDLKNCITSTVFSLDKFKSKHKIGGVSLQVAKNLKYYHRENGKYKFNLAIIQPIHARNLILAVRKYNSEKTEQRAIVSITGNTPKIEPKVVTKRIHTIKPKVELVKEGVKVTSNQIKLFLNMSSNQKVTVEFKDNELHINML